MEFDNPTAVTFDVEPETRTIRGLVVPYGEIATNGGQQWTFTSGSLTWDKVKLLNGHDWNQVLGIAELTETDEGIEMAAKVARGPRGDEVLELAAMGAIDGLSMGLAQDVKATRKGSVNHVTAATIREVSTTPIPAFENAAIRSVAASADHKEKTTMENDTPAFSATDGEALATKVAELTTKIDGLAEIKAPLPPGKTQFQITEEPLYRFDGITAASGHDMSADLISGLAGDHEAMDRLIGFMNESLINPAGLNFVATTDVDKVNPSTYRPDLFKDEEPEQPTPMYSAFYAGGLSNVTPFFYSKLGAYSGLLGDHTQGTPPSAGSFTTETGATITPSAVSGRIFLTREVADQGGNPQVSGLIWSKFQRVFRQTLETKTAKLLHDNLANFTALASPTTGADGGAIGAALKQGLVDLQFTANGQRFVKFFAAKDLYSQLAAAEDDHGRPLFPILAASNADGNAANRLGNINVAGINLEPTWSTEIGYPVGEPAVDTPDDTSFYVDPGAAKVWNSGLTKIDKVGETAAGWNIDVFAYVAAHLYDASGIRKITYKAA